MSKGSFLKEQNNLSPLNISSIFKIKITLKIVGFRTRQPIFVVHEIVRSYICLSACPLARVY
jgi:ATP sulfurylase